MAETGTALSVVEAQQNIVGGTLVGAAGAGVLAETPGDSTSQILEQIREIQVQTLRAVRSVADGIIEMVAFDKLQDRRALEDKTENEKEAEKILKNLGYNKKTIKSFIRTVQNHVASEFQDMKEIMMGKVPKRLLN